MLEGTAFPSNMAAKTTTWLYLVKRLIVMLKFVVNTATDNISLTIFLKLKCKICIQEDVIHKLRKSHSAHVTRYEITHFKEVMQVFYPGGGGGGGVLPYMAFKQGCAARKGMVFRGFLSLTGYQFHHFLS